MSKRIQKTKCPKCNTKIDVTEQLELGNYDKIGSITYIYCPLCGEEIIITTK